MVSENVYFSTKSGEFCIQKCLQIPLFTYFGHFVYTFVGHQYLMLSEYSGNFVRKYNINDNKKNRQV